MEDVRVNKSNTSAVDLLNLAKINGPDEQSTNIVDPIEANGVDKPDIYIIVDDS